MKSPNVDPDDLESTTFTGCIIANGQVYHATEPFPAATLEQAEEMMQEQANVFALASGHPAVDPRDLLMALRVNVKPQEKDKDHPLINRMPSDRDGPQGTRDDTR